MCGIAGIFAYRDTSPTVDREELVRVREAMARRGPDGEGLWIAQDGRLRHTLLMHASSRIPSNTHLLAALWFRNVDNPDHSQ